ncbi:flagellar protein FlgN [Chengkuizengella axinellae]|uniref:Flagellar protein FlgN n=1 Tax=Chengkuizengella axinellae TaxID=3064388 RepID=A0ABT9J2Q0_9BACL|nr:flagellar protein FlgN [Chengkuizengella sp. 2205SS18-9]MDP5275881.1 flagellar protein FlgN [Chengkuizengella sp. 2205SS18-9]
MSVDDIVQHLEVLDQLHFNLLELGKQKKQVIIDNNIEELKEMMNQESMLIKQISDIDSKRVQAVINFARQKGVQPNPNITITELSRFIIDPEEKKALITAQGKLLKTMDEMKHINQLNQKLIEQSLSYINVTMEAALGTSNDHATYQNPLTSQQQGSRKGIFDVKG